VVVEGHSVGRIAGFTFHPDPDAVGDEKKLVLRAARRALREEMPRRVRLVETLPDTAFSLTDEQAVLWDGEPIARLRRGSSAVRPRVQVMDSEFIDGAQRERIRLRLQRFIDDKIAVDLRPLQAATSQAAAQQSLRGQLHRLTEALGVMPCAEDDRVAPELRAALKVIGVKAGRFALYMPALLKARPMAMRASLWALHHGVAVPRLPAADSVSLPPQPDWPAGFAEAMGWLDAGPVLLRLDIAERIAGELAWTTRRGPTALPVGLASRFSLKAELLPVVLRRLGFRVVPAGGLAPEEYGPPSPAMIMPARRRRQAAAPVVANQAHGPFAALAALKR
jgi:ATP-dependent RNA helicase SUPV3L1/SUV3